MCERSISWVWHGHVGLTSSRSNGGSSSICRSSSSGRERSPGFQDQHGQEHRSSSATGTAPEHTESAREALYRKMRISMGSNNIFTV